MRARDIYMRARHSEAAVWGERQGYSTTEVVESGAGIRVTSVGKRELFGRRETKYAPAYS